MKFMTLTSHAIAGAAAAQFFPSNPVLAFSAGFVSHFLLDFIPHWDYDVLSGKEDPNNPLNYDMVLGEKFLIDLARIGFDACLGIVLSLAIFTQLNDSAPLLAFAGAIGGITPDPFQFLYWKTKVWPLTYLQKFHVWVQKDKNLKVKPVIGFLLQAVLISGIVFSTLILT